MAEPMCDRLRCPVSSNSMNFVKSTVGCNVREVQASLLRSLTATTNPRRRSADAVPVDHRINPTAHPLAADAITLAGNRVGRADRAGRDRGERRVAPRHRVVVGQPPRRLGIEHAGAVRRRVVVVK